MGPLHHRNLMSLSSWTRAIGLVVLLNLLFGILALWRASLPVDPFRERIRQAFEDGDLVQQDYLPFDHRRGFHQYDECLILQMIANDDETLVRRAIGPTLYVRDTTYTEYCRALHEVVVDRAPTDRFIREAYTRYWHGYMPVTAALLIAVDIGTARKVLMGVSYLALLALLVAALSSENRPVRIVGLSIALSGALIWGLPYFGQTFSHAIGDIVMILGLFVLLRWGDRLCDPSRLPVYCAGYGAVVVNFEFMTGQLPTAAGFLFPLIYTVALSTPGSTRRGAWRLAGSGLLAFGLGVGLAVGVKQVLALIAFGSRPLESFAMNLSFYMGSATSDYPLPEPLLPFARFVDAAETLTYGSEGAAYALYAASCLAWVLGGYLAFSRRLRKRRERETRSDYLALVVGAALVIVWILSFQTHTYHHAEFMVRISIVPIGLGWAALVWQSTERFA